MSETKRDVPPGEFQEAQFGPKTRYIPTDWKIGRLGDNTYLKGRIGWHGLTEDDHMENGEYFLVTGTDFENGRVQWDRCKYVDKDWYEKDPNIQLEEKDILVTKDGSIGKTAFVESLPGDATLNNGVFVLRPLNNDYLPEFFYYVLNSPYFDDFIETITAGSTISHLYQKDFVNFQFPLPPLAEQRHIADILLTVDKQIEQTKEAIPIFQEIREGVLQDILAGETQNKKQESVRVGPTEYDIPSHWELQTVEELLAKQKKAIRGGPAGSRIKKDDRSNTGYKIYFQENIIKSDFDYRNDYITEEKFQELSDMEPIPGDILVTLTGNVGECAVFPDGAERGIYESNVMRIRVNDALCIPEYLCELLDNSKIIDDQILSMSHGGTRKKLNNKIVKSLMVPIPPKDEQEEIMDVLYSIDSKIETEKKILKKQKQLKYALMQDLLTGKVRTSPPSK